MTKFFNLIFLLLFSLIGTSQTKQDHLRKEGLSSNLEALKLEYKNSLKTKNDNIIYETLSPILVHYSGTNEWDSLSKYCVLTSDYAKKVGDLEIHLKLIMMDISTQELALKNTSNKKERIGYLNQFLGDTTLSGKRQYELYNMVGSYMISQNNADSSIFLQEKAVEYAKIADEKKYLYIGAITELGNTYKSFGKYDKALESLLEAERYVEMSTLPAFTAYNFHNLLGQVFAKIGDYPKAIEYFNNSIAIAKKEGYTTSKNASNVNLGFVYYKMGDFNTALNLYNSSASYFRSKGKSKKLGKVHSNISQIYFDMKDYVKADQYLDSAYVHISTKTKENATNYGFYKSRVKTDLKLGDIRSAEKFFNIIKDNQLQGDDKNGDFEKLKYLIAKKRGDSQNALKSYEKFQSKRDSFSNSLVTMRTQRIESEFNRKQQKAKIENLSELTSAQNKAIATRNSALLIGGFMLLLLAGLLFGLYKLYLKNKQNQKKLASQNVKITKALSENQMLLKEIHHRVKNNLQVISSLLSMQARKITDKDTKDALNSSKTRVQSMSILHQNLYQGDNLKDIDIEVYMERLIHNIVDTYNISDNVQFHIDIENLQLDVDTLIPIGLITNELVCNALKYAFEGREKGNLYVSFSSTASTLTLRVADDGVGFEGDSLPVKEGSIGARLVNSFVAKLEGKMVIDSSNGAEIVIVFDKDKI